MDKGNPLIGVTDTPQFEEACPLKSDELNDPLPLLAPVACTHPTPMKKTLICGAALLASSLAATPALAADPVRIDFEGTTEDVGGFRGDVAVSDFYAGGSSKVPGTAIDVQFGVLPGIGAVFNPSTLVTETSAGGNGGATSVFGQTRNLLLEDGTQLTNSTALGNGVAYSGLSSFITVTFAAGFSNAVSFFFNAGSDLTVSVLRQDGSVLYSDDFTFSSSTLCPTSESRCAWNAASLSFTGTAYGVSFFGVPSDFAIDNLTLGQADPLSPLNGGGGQPPIVTPIPEPSTYALMAAGLGVVAWVARRRRRDAELSA